MRLPFGPGGAVASLETTGTGCLLSIRDSLFGTGIFSSASTLLMVPLTAAIGYTITLRAVCTTFTITTPRAICTACTITIIQATAAARATRMRGFLQ